MADFPTIFYWLARAEPLRGFPAAYLVLALAAVVVAVGDWRAALLALMGQYLVAGLLFVDVLDPRLAVVKVLVGLFICLMLYITARQVSWGRLPPDVRPAEVAHWRRGRMVAVGRWQLPLAWLLRLGLTLGVVWLVLAVAGRPSYQLPAVPAHVNLAIYALCGLGLLGMGLTTEPLPAGMGLLLFMTGFELFFNTLEQSVAMLAMLAVTQMGLTLAIAYLTQMWAHSRFVLPVLLEE